MQALLFDDDESGSGPVPPALLPDPAALGGAAGLLFQVSANAYDALVCVWMSGLPLEAQALRYGLKVLAAAKRAALAAERGAGDPPSGLAKTPAPSGDGGKEGRNSAGSWYARGGAREGAEGAARNRGDGDCLAVLAAAYKVAHEIDRLMGFLRFKPDARGRYIARCAPDYLVLPALAPHFIRRFGPVSWAIIDEKRGLVLLREGKTEPRLLAAGKDSRLQGEGLESRDTGSQDIDPWEKIWRSYHRVINIESRKNLRLQGQFIPLRYREYLSEFGPG
jgi:probable DNA metabolism protein